MTDEALSTICDASFGAAIVGLATAVIAMFAYVRSAESSIPWFRAIMAGFGILTFSAITGSIASGERTTTASVHHDSDQACEAMERRGDTWICTRIVREP